MKANHVASTTDCAQKRVTGEEMICTQIAPGLVTLAIVPGSRATRTLPVVFRFNRSGGVSRRVIDELPTMQEFEDRVRIERCSFPFGLARLAEKNHLDCYSSAR